VSSSSRSPRTDTVCSGSAWPVGAEKVPPGRLEGATGVGGAGATGGAAAGAGARNSTAALMRAATGMSSLFAGSKRHVLTAAAAASAKGLSPRTTFTSVTAPRASTTIVSSTDASPRPSDGYGTAAPSSRCGGTTSGDARATAGHSMFATELAARSSPPRRTRKLTAPLRGRLRAQRVDQPWTSGATFARPTPSRMRHKAYRRDDSSCDFRPMASASPGRTFGP
jgi:hypothetical protein